MWRKKKQPFFKNSKSGNHVTLQKRKWLIKSVAKKVILNKNDKNNNNKSW